jgi:hypothetical protein
VACRRYGQLPGGRREHGVGDRGHGFRLEVLHLAVQPGQDLGWVGCFHCVRAQGAAHAAHDDRGLQTGTGDVAHHQAELAGGQREHVVPVAADPAVSGDVTGSDLRTGHRGQLRGKQALLERRRRGMVVAQSERLHDQGRTLGGQLEQLGVVAGEHTAADRADVQDADYSAVDQQRHADQGPDPFLQQDRIEHVSVINMIKDHRPHLCGDAAGEALADRDTDTLPDLLLQATRGRGDQLTG